MSSLERAFSDRDFEDMMYAVHTVEPGQNVYAKFPGMHKMPSFTNFRDPHLEKSMVIKYVVFAYDRGSPIFIKFRNDEIKRKTTAALYAGWEADPVHGHFNEFVDKMLCCFHKDVNLMVLDYVRQYNDPLWSLLITGHDAYYKKLEVLAQTAETAGGKNKYDLKDEETSGKIFMQAEQMAVKLEEIAGKILTDENRYLKKSLFSVIDESKKNKLNISPEELAGID